MGRGGNWNKKKEKVFTLGDSIIKQRKELKTKNKKKTGQTSDEDFVERFRRKDLGKIKLFHLAFTTIWRLDRLDHQSW